MSSKEFLNPSILATDNNTVASPIDQTMLQQLDNIMGHELMLILTQQLLTAIPQQLATLQQLYTIGDMKALYHRAHQLKGESWQIGATQLGTLCEQLEELAQQGQIEAMPTNLNKIETEWMQVKVALIQVNNNG